jgi:hypothetical protein
MDLNYIKKRISVYTMSSVLHHRELTAEEDHALWNLYCQSFYTFNWSTREWIRQCWAYSAKKSIVRPYGYGKTMPTREDKKKTNESVRQVYENASRGTSYGYAGLGYEGW